MEESIAKKKFIILISLLGICIITCTVLYFILGYTAYDLKGHWRICKYTLLGENPFLLIGKKALTRSVGKIPKGFSTVPWSCVFGGLFYGSFLDLEDAKTYIWLLHFTAYLAVAVVVYRRLRNTYSNKVILLLVLLVGSHFSFMYSLRFGNAGAIICCLIVMSICMLEDHPWIAGIFMGFAMMKPQIAMIVCFAYLLNRKWMPLFVAAAIDISGWICTSIVTHTSPFELLKGTFSKGTVSNLQYLGLLSFLQNYGMNRNVVLLLNIFIGILFTYILWYYLKKRCKVPKDALILYAPSCAASTFWVYKNGTDYLILAFVAAFFVVMIMKNKMEKSDFTWVLLSVVFLEMSRCAVYFGILLGGKSEAARNMIKSIDGFLIAFVTIILCVLWKKYESNKVL